MSRTNASARAAGARFELPWTAAPLTQNSVRRMHFYIEAKHKKLALAEVADCIARAMLDPVTGPAHVTLHYQPGTRRRLDADGLAPTLKVVLDALVHMGVLEDDGFDHVPLVSIHVHQPVKGKGGRLWVELREVES